ncbi:MAG TPA: GDSL-type esterase/lipase family protein [Candidatus Limnocylindrales bacterium]|nr:GDSL-type esterase/lipase family protein [Candidatus Limnocylindrales bacterium]
MRLVCLGDSLTAGEYGGSYVNAMRHLRPDLNVINAGVGGDTVLNLQARLDADVLAQGPDGVFLMIGGNDAVSWSQPKTRPYYKNAKQVPGGVVTPEAFARAYRDLLGRLQLAHVLVWAGLPPVEANPAVVEAVREFNALASEAARAYAVPALDLMAAFAPETVPERLPLDVATINTIGARMQAGWQDYNIAQAAGGYTFTFDGLHLMPEAAERMGALVADFIEG